MITTEAQNRAAYTANLLMAPTPETAALQPLGRPAAIGTAGALATPVMAATPAEALAERHRRRCLRPATPSERAAAEALFTELFGEFYG